MKPKNVIKCYKNMVNNGRKVKGDRIKWSVIIWNTIMFYYMLHFSINVYYTWKMLFTLHPHNNGTTALHIGCAPHTIGPIPCEGLLYHCCVGVIHQSSPIIHTFNYGKWSKHSQCTTMTQHQGTLGWSPHIGSHNNDTTPRHIGVQGVQGSLPFNYNSYL
jgi:hypothetical protein